MTLLLQFFGISDSLHLFELEQRYPRGPVFAGFRPCQLDRLLSWGQQTAQMRCWDLDLVHQAVLQGWLSARADSSVATALTGITCRSAFSDRAGQ